MLYKVDEKLLFEYSIEILLGVLSCGTVYCAVQGGSNF